MWKNKEDKVAYGKKYRESPKGRRIIDAYTNSREYKDMRKEYAKAWRAMNSEKTKEINQRARHKWTYGESYDEKLKRLVLQGGCCANPGCRTKEPGPQGWHTDHDHVTNKVRGELCHGCNLALGLLKDNDVRVEGLAVYLRQHK